MPRETERWLRQAQEDLITAEVNLKAERYYARALFAQQAAEKALIGLFIERRRQSPERTHDLECLGRLMGVPEEYIQGLDALTRSYLASRYPDFGEGGIPADSVKQSIATSYLEIGRRIVLWVERELPTGT